MQTSNIQNTIEGTHSIQPPQYPESEHVRNEFLQMPETIGPCAILLHVHDLFTKDDSVLWKTVEIVQKIYAIILKAEQTCIVALGAIIRTIGLASILYGGSHMLWLLTTRGLILFAEEGAPSVFALFVESGPLITLTGGMLFNQIGDALMGNQPIDNIVGIIPYYFPLPWAGYFYQNWRPQSSICRPALPNVG